MLVNGVEGGTSIWISSTHINFMAPSGSGADAVVAIRFGDQMMTVDVAAVGGFSYDPPILYSVETFNALTSGGTYVKLIGMNFGTASGDINYVKIGGQICDKPTVLSDTEIQCIAPPMKRCNTVAIEPTCIPTSRRSAITMSIALASPSVNNLQCPLFDYAAPLITELFSADCVVDQRQGFTNLRLRECPTMSTTTLTIHGLNFGSSHSIISVTVGTKGHSCRVLSHDEFQVICLIEGGIVGQKQNVVVHTAMGTTSERTPARISFLSPRLEQTTWAIPSSAHISESFIMIVGTNFGTPPVDSSFSLDGRNNGGRPSSISEYLTVSVGDAPCRYIVHHNTTHISCNVPEGIGAHNIVRVTVAGQSTPDEDLAVVNYVPTTMGVTPRIVQTNTVVTMHGTGFVYSPLLTCRFVCNPSLGNGACANELNRDPPVRKNARRMQKMFTVSLLFLVRCCFKIQI